MVIGPAWTRGEIEKPAGTKNMGSWTAAVYTPEQQARLGVDESGNKVADLAQAAAPPKLCGAIGPAWTRGEIEKPAGTKNMGSWTAAVYTPEQQARLGVDESGNKVPDLAKAAAPPQLPKLGAICGAIGPAWTRGEIEKPAGTKNMGSWTAAVYTPEQQARLGVDESGNKVPDLAEAAAPPKLCGAIGPAWTRGEIEKPAGTKNMGSWTAAVYTPEQQARLGVDESGKKVADLAKAAAPPKLCGAIGPAWTRGEIEKPAGTKNMGSWTAAVYTPEQQARLGVDEFGKKVADPAKAAAPPKLGATLGSIGPAWTRGEIEKPAGTKTMDTFAGSWTAAAATSTFPQRIEALA
ncbi:unnamed protein product [Symbiodinium natans]|uniref:Uncharacterized protein n=1 Tax=Symbiodinium natans TaxID=878477 RepID=A0A812NIT3_9DINO|nr:unnamed protein product [Symbiodinium natans]